VDLRSISSPVHELGNEPIRFLGLRAGRVFIVHPRGPNSRRS
jgi:hypothetical protein